MSRWLGSAIAQCDNCDWKMESFNAEMLGAKHAKEYGHKVWVDLTFYNVFDYSEMETDEKD